MRSEESLLGANLVSWKASHDAMASTAEIVNEDRRIVFILSLPDQDNRKKCSSGEACPSVMGRPSFHFKQRFAAAMRRW